MIVDCDYILSIMSAVLPVRFRALLVRMGLRDKIADWKGRITENLEGAGTLCNALVLQQLLR